MAGYAGFSAATGPDYNADLPIQTLNWETSADTLLQLDILEVIGAFNRLFTERIARLPPVSKIKIQLRSPLKGLEPEPSNSWPATPLAWLSGRLHHCIPQLTRKYQG